MKDLKTQLKFISWHDHDSLKIIDVSNKDNICKVIRFTGKEEEFVELGSSYIPFLDKEKIQGNFFKDETPFDRDDTVLRLMRKHQELRILGLDETN